jgi:hypothetical protein
LSPFSDCRARPALERALLQHVGERGADAEPLPDFAERRRPAEAQDRCGQGPVGVLVERIDEQRPIGELGARDDERGEPTGGGQFVGAPRIGDDGLAHGAFDALVLDDLRVSAFARPLEAEEHGGPKAERHRIRFAIEYQTEILCKRGAAVGENTRPSSMMSTGCEREAKITVQVGPELQRHDQSRRSCHGVEVNVNRP